MGQVIMKASGKNHKKVRKKVGDQSQSHSSKVTEIHNMGRDPCKVRK